MTDTKRLLEFRKKIKKRKPIFIRKDAHKVVRVAEKWRQPRGRHSAIRQKHKGHPKLVSIGYGSPRMVRALHSSGLKKIIINNLNQLDKIDPKIEGIIISRTVGNIKRKEIIKKALNLKIEILNFKNPQKQVETIDHLFQKRLNLIKKL